MYPFSPHDVPQLQSYKIEIEIQFLFMLDRTEGLGLSSEQCLKHQTVNIDDIAAFESGGVQHILKEYHYILPIYVG